MEHDSESQPKWYALTVRRRQEARIVAALRLKNFEAFAPLRETGPSRSHHRVNPAALFPGYAFCRFDRRDSLSIVGTEGVLTVVSFGRWLAPLEDTEVDALRRADTAGVVMEATPYIVAGDRVRICHGALRGIEGILLETRGRNRVVISITLLRRSVALEIDKRLLLRLEPSRFGATAERGLADCPRLTGQAG